MNHIKKVFLISIFSCLISSEKAFCQIDYSPFNATERESIRMNMVREKREYFINGIDTSLAFITEFDESGNIIYNKISDFNFINKFYYSGKFIDSVEEFHDQVKEVMIYKYIKAGAKTQIDTGKYYYVYLNEKNDPVKLVDDEGYISWQYDRNRIRKINYVNLKHISNTQDLFSYSPSGEVLREEHFDKTSGISVKNEIHNYFYNNLKQLYLSVFESFKDTKLTSTTVQFYFYNDDLIKKKLSFIDGKLVSESYFKYLFY